MELAFSYVYKITILPSELDRIIIGYLIKDKFNRLRNKLQSFYDDRKYYKFLKDNHQYEEISYYDLLKFDTYKMQYYIRDKYTIRYNNHCSIVYIIEYLDDNVLGEASNSLHGIIYTMYKNIYRYGDEYRQTFCMYNYFGVTPTKSELLEMDVSRQIIKKSD